jgi:hypothetical protein
MNEPRDTGVLGGARASYPILSAEVSRQTITGKGEFVVCICASIPNLDRLLSLDDYGRINRVIALIAAGCMSTRGQETLRPRRTRFSLKLSCESNS